VAYNKEKKIIYAAALVKRHVALIDNDGDGKEDIKDSTYMYWNNCVHNSFQEYSKVATELST